MYGKVTFERCKSVSGNRATLKKRLLQKSVRGGIGTTWKEKLRNIRNIVFFIY